MVEIFLVLAYLMILGIKNSNIKIVVAKEPKRAAVHARVVCLVPT